MTGRAQANWFDQGGEAYARFRPDYPPELARSLAALAPGRSLALDVGAGSGQLTRLLAEHFLRVVGVDPSADQLAHAVPHARIQYAVAPAEALPPADGTTDLITAAQAAHWFDLPRFYAEVRRVAVPGALLALVSYGVSRLDDALQPRFLRFYTDEIGAFWPPERRLVESGYAELDFPFEELPKPAHEIRRAWDLDTFLGYVSTWSATRRARDAGRHELLTRFGDDLRALWGDPARPRTIVWPIALRLGRVPPA